MNFLDTYDITTSSGGSSTPPPDQPQQSLNEELARSTIIEQSQSVFETARKDFGDVVTQAQKELGKLTSTAEGSSVEGTTSTSTEDADEVTPTASSTATLNEAELNAPASTSTESTSSPSSPSGWNTQALFSRLQSALPPNVVSTVQSHIPESIRHASENIDLAQIRTNLLSEVQRIQGVTRAQAEEYVHKSEALLREAVKEAQEVLKDAVKVIPPDEAHSASNSSPSSLIWDGSDMWMLPGDAETTGNAAADATADSGKGKGKSVDAGVAAVATRAEALLRRLRHDPVIVRMDPESDGATQELYAAWVQKEVASKEGGLEGEAWQTTITKALDDTGDGEALASMKDTLVPSEMTEAEFWQRFFFRTHQIKEEEEKRKALLQVNTESEDDFDWDDEDSDEEDGEEEEKVVAKEATPTRPPATTTKEVSGPAPPSSATSTRESSLDSFDVVSSANVSSTGEAAKQQGNAVKKDEEEEEDDEEDDDSDWE
ncbi:hypothetical protein D9756_005404 [Leucocoprinus leucothites]|uniref:BSD domain-containing protein n=1 Tax=Leucocoprinus leucothites TaxID=201217 RepID=A0A8H5D7F6_9AGAR|nr:hypothetical protein D9756_005404 [Leucoagaricus leucothites]